MPGTGKRTPAWKEARTVDIPRPVFLYTLDQIAASLSMTLEKLIERHVFFQDLAPAARPMKEKLCARNIALVGEPYDWRISEHEYKRWLIYKGFRQRYEGALY